jgi:hypothetical protein
MPRPSRTALALAALALAAAGCGDFRYETYVAELDGALEGVTTTATGRAIVLVSKRGDRAEISLSVAGMQNEMTGAFVRRAPRGQSGNVVYTLWMSGQGPFDDRTPILRIWDQSGRAVAAGGEHFTSATQVVEPFTRQLLEDLRAGNLYVNVQTRQRPSGEIRGQLLPE